MLLNISIYNFVFPDIIFDILNTSFKMNLLGIFDSCNYLFGV